MLSPNQVGEARPGAPGAFESLRRVMRNLEAPHIYEEALRRGEGRVARGGALAVETGAHTGRAAQDKFIVRDAVTETTVWWPSCRSLSPEHFDRLMRDMLAHARSLELFAQDLSCCAHPPRRLPVRVYTEYAWHSLFIRNLLRREEEGDRKRQFIVLDLPSFRAGPARHGCRSETVIALDFRRGIALIGGTRYAGEIKKAIFSYLSFLLPAQGVMPMHCSANVGAGGSALFFGLSGTGKTTLSAEPSRRLIGDDEHGWDESGVFNLEGGCYAKAIRLSRDDEPQIFAAAQRFGAIMENVALDPATRRPDFDDDSLTENTRVAYPLGFIPNAAEGCADHPKNIVMLTCDAFGVLPPIAKLSAAQAVYHFLSGYTARVAGTEEGIKEPLATFSTCFGAPFMPRRPWEYAALLRERIERHGVGCWLLNTGWSGGAVGVGRHMPHDLTRRLLRAALDGSLAESAFRVDPRFGLAAPISAPAVAPDMLDPARAWAVKREFVETADRLVEMFRQNFAAFAPFVERDVADAQPRRLSG